MYRALSVKPSWAHCIVHGKKRIENRSWNTGYRGWWWLHASAQEGARHYSQTVDMAWKWGVLLPPKAQLRSGGIIAAVRLLDVRPTPADRFEPWELSGGYAWQLGQVVPLEFLACRGHQTWWTPTVERFEVPDDFRRLLRYQAMLPALVSGDAGRAE